jgi:hypothetical protein
MIVPDNFMGIGNDLIFVKALTHGNSALHDGFGGSASHLLPHNGDRLFATIEG